jgi:uncharacterized membrane protein
VKIAESKLTMVSAFILTIAFGLFALREANIWLWNASCYSGWVGLPKHTGEIEKVKRTAESAFRLMLLGLLGASSLFAVASWILWRRRNSAMI